MRTSVVIVCGVLAVLVALEQASAQKVCPQCACPAIYDPVCAFNKVTRRYRGFSSRCEMDCTNKCRQNRFDFHAKGRCGKDKIQQRPAPTPAPTDV
ncbi:hypothetical protein R5R35_012937 [Gryllus longicercus]|uniref:Kazal-like domain-containing protein n=1 Tax=Gryllus longicercus TaxID=2509291 RepID=A0AAN9W0M2_9ORTH